MISTLVFHIFISESKATVTNNKIINSLLTNYFA